MVDDRRICKPNAVAEYKSLRIAIEICALLGFDMVGDRRNPKNLDGDSLLALLLYYQSYFLLLDDRN